MTVHRGIPHELHTHATDRKTALNKKTAEDNFRCLLPENMYD